MNKFYLLLLLPLLLFGQYYGERVTEKSFESSDLFFNSYYLNTFGIYNFRNVSTGLFDDPFLRLHLNPALLPEDSTSKTEVYLDFRGDRTEAEIVQYNYYPPYLYNSYASSRYIDRIDPRWYSITRTEPEPVFSLGIIAHPFNKKFLVGATYQLIYRQEPYYQQPTGIYNSRYGKSYDGYDLVANSEDIPIVDRYSGSDEMLTSAHLFGGFLGYKLTPKLNVGININTVMHEREGQYANLNNDQYSTQDNRDWFSTNSVERNSDYNHIDVSAGISYKLNEQITAAIKLGLLDGEANQDYAKYDSSSYHYDSDPDDWSRSLNTGKTDQDWNHEGTGKYGTVNLDYKFENNEVSIYYSHRKNDIDLKTTSVIQDTSYYAGEWTSSYAHSEYESYSSLSDIRDSNGKNEQTRNEAMLSIRWRETKNVTVYAGFYFANIESSIENDEPVIARNQSSYYSFYDYTNPTDEDYEYTSYYSNYENKRLLWNYTSKRQSIQIPVVLDFHLNESWNVILGVNRIWEHWDVSDQTLAVFTNRTENRNGDIESETNFGERYTQPDEKFTDNNTEFMAGLSINITPKLKVNILVEPENEPNWRVAQWWLAFRASL
ncbi:MAG: hypothetical protein P8Y99_11215 [Calditrichaceae bacterium]